MAEPNDRFFPSAGDRGKRLDVFLAHRIKNASRERIKASIQNGSVSINNVAVQKPDYRIKGDEEIAVRVLPEDPGVSPPPESIPIPVLYEDEHIMIMNKPAGISTHPTARALHNSVVNALLSMDKKLSDMGDAMRRGIVHRLDKQTCGVLIIAKDNESHMALLRMFRQREIHKTYLAVTYGVVKKDTGTIEGFINRHPVDRMRMTTKTTKGRKAVTSFRVIKRFDEATVVMLHPQTGRTHQLRTQLSDMGYPIVNDALYSRRRPEFRDLRLNSMVSQLKGIALFAYSIGFLHPVDNTAVQFSAPFPAWLTAVLEEHELP